MMCFCCFLGSLLVLQQYCMPSHRLCFAWRVIAGWKPIFFKFRPKFTLLTLTVVWCCKTDTFDNDVLI